MGEMGFGSINAANDDNDDNGQGDKFGDDNEEETGRDDYIILSVHN